MLRCDFLIFFVVQPSSWLDRLCTKAFRPCSESGDVYDASHEATKGIVPKRSTESSANEFRMSQPVCFCFCLEAVYNSKF